MSTVTDTTCAPHYVRGGGCDGWRLLDRPGLSVKEGRIPPGSREERHRPAKAVEFFHVCDSELTLEAPGTIRKIGPRQALPVFPRKPHKARNATQTDACLLVIAPPSTLEDREPA